jgi:hypothetical protein
VSEVVKIKVGDYIASEFCAKGKVIAITKEWVIYENENGVEFCNNKDDCNFWIPAEIEWDKGAER